MSERKPSRSSQSLQVALDANAAAYRRAVQSSVPGDCWDYVVLTAANEKQAQGYRQELALRHRVVGPTGAFFPALQRSIVVADPPGRRAGSGGATLGVMRALIEQFNLSLNDLQNARILLIHSGGASQRLPAFSSLGKIFAPLPLLRPDGQIATLFDHLYLTLAALPERLGPGMLILAGDVFLLFDHRHVTAPPPGVTALTMRVDADMGRGHGVFVIDEKSRAITETLQKVSVETMRLRGASDTHGKVLIDTGLLFFDAPRTRLLAMLAGASERKPKKGLHERHAQQLDLYDDMTAALASGTTEKNFLAEVSTRAMRKEIWQALHGIPFQAIQLEGEFLHLGTTRQFRDAMIGQNPSPAAELFQQDVLTHSQWKIGPGRRVYHSVLLADQNKTGSLGTGSVVEHSILRAPSRIGAGSVVSQVFAQSTPIDLGDNLLFFQAPVRARDKLEFVQVVCGVEDDFKGAYADGKCIFRNRPIDEWLTTHGISANEIWRNVPKEKRTLWTARIFPATENRDAAQIVLAGGKKSTDVWRKSSRYSMAMILEQADPRASIEHREVILAYLQTSELLGAIDRRIDRPVESMIGSYSSPAAYAAAEQLLGVWSNRKPAGAEQVIDQSRALWCCAQLLQRADHPDAPGARAKVEPVMRRAFEKIALASELGHSSSDLAMPPAPKLPINTEIIATSPVRLDLAGGWSDTPPYCYERGGHVINLAIDLDSRPPVRATLQTIREKKIVLESADLGRRIEFARGTFDGTIDVRDPLALHKVALMMTGILPEAGGDIARHLNGLGAGLHVITECRVPKGSGLGTSSILAATLLAALHELRGQKPTTEELIEQTLLVEQRMSTGGGWQDQVGGIVGGVKSTVSKPGIPQSPQVEKLALTDQQYESLQERLVVYFSGQQRLARDILRRVMGRWIAREPAVIQLTDQLKASARNLRTALLKGRWPAVGNEIGAYWRIKKELYPGSATPTIDVLFLELRELYLSAGLAGAGGGGFAYFFCKSARQASRLRDALGQQSGRPGSLGAVYETQINRTGLVVRQNRL